ncbi:hypothetical protein JT258_02310 [Helicobacter pylori]|uniref:hypothetical protein n=1 Tax=Helicobacter pylori TaxID=210 RepID=UPI000F720D94|nr:hypothetical protein [Helicobacter pylori]MCQ2894957.1 hypothetical protein [Helicobacter pylori]VEJ23865.1 Uncharacterised protein [Helicobacter pylori]
MKALKTFLKKSLILLLAVASNHLNAVAMIVDNPTQNAWNGAKRAWDESKWAKHLATITERIKLAQDTLDRANQTLNSINKVNDVLNKTNQFLTGSILSIPNPMQYVEKIQSFAKQVQANAERIKENAQNYDIRNQIAAKRISEKCPELNWDVSQDASPTEKNLHQFFTSKGKESANTKALKDFVNAIGNTQISTANDLGAGLRGRALLEYICIQKGNLEAAKKIQLLDSQMTLALLNNDYTAYEKLRAEKEELKRQIASNVYAKVKQLVVASQDRAFSQMDNELGVKTFGFNDENVKKGYCKKENRNGKSECIPNMLNINRLKAQFDELNLDYSRDIAGKKGEAAAKVFNDYKHRFQQLSVETALEIAQNLSFMNNTLGLMAQMQSYTFKQQMGYFEDIIPADALKDDKEHQENLKQKQQEIEKVYRAKLDAYGFPNGSVGKTSGVNSNSNNEAPSSDNIQSFNPY